jgi:hypothetical protein
MGDHGQTLRRLVDLWQEVAQCAPFVHRIAQRR